MLIVVTFYAGVSLKGDSFMKCLYLHKLGIEDAVAMALDNSQTNVNPRKIEKLWGQAFPEIG